jgi:hypothetical protein
MLILIVILIYKYIFLNGKNILAYLYIGIMRITKQEYINILDHYNIKYNKNMPLNLLRKTAEKVFAGKLCRCIKKVDNYKDNEARAIAICNNSVILNKDLRIYGFTCKNKQQLKSLKNAKPNASKVYKRQKTIKLIPIKIPKRRYAKTKKTKSN